MCIPEEVTSRSRPKAGTQGIQEVEGKRGHGRV